MSVRYWEQCKAEVGKEVRDVNTVVNAFFPGTLGLLSGVDCLSKNEGGYNY